MALHDDLRRAARDFPEQAALEFEGATITYGALHAQAQAVAAGLQGRGHRRGCAIAIMLPNCPEFIAIACGAFTAGHVATPLSVLLTPFEARHILRDSAPEVLFVDAVLVPVIEAAMVDLDRTPDLVVLGGDAGAHTDFGAFLASCATATPLTIAPDDHLLTLYTSGTTGPAKGVMLSPACLRAQVDMILGTFKPGPDTRILCALPLFHAYALNALVGTAFRTRATIVLHPRFDAAACARSLAQGGITWFAGVPTMYALLLEEGDRRPGLRFPDLDICLAGGAAMSSAVLSGFERRFGPAILEGYGLTETTVSVASNAAAPDGRKPGSVGRPYAGIEARAIDKAGRTLPAGTTGELVFRGANVMLGYLNRPDDTAQVLEDGWLRSGDLGHVDADGFCFIAGRLKDLIVKSGYNIVPSEVETAIRCAGLVRDAAVLGLPDPVRGERILAAVILKDGADPALARRQIDAAVKARLSRYKHPSAVWFIDRFPLGPSGKILKPILRDTWLATSDTRKDDVYAPVPA
ncbi:AMP-binding protein [Marivita sp. GX14005]|uniref:class I adenylate-forming enzyme family protein n=1 Tax=Marivita sp. GX14005 TaxID=2942276 RepID=UPI0020194A28|nr:AMP-binding protein [Marivita sp. GX14005]MCL3883032.1 AMP-binding protein [Marivita sp. GX14005]